MKTRYKKGTPLMKLIEDPKPGMKYHVAWGKSHGVIGVYSSVDPENKTVKLKSPKTKKLWNCDVKWDDLRYTRTEQFKLNRK